MHEIMKEKPKQTKRKITSERPGSSNPKKTTSSSTYSFEVKIKTSYVTSDEEATSNLPFGKLKKDGTRTVINSQAGASCTLFAARRLYDGRHGKDLGSSKEYKAYKILKKAFAEEHTDKEKIGYGYLLEQAEKACEILGKNPDTIYNSSKVVSFDVYRLIEGTPLTGSITINKIYNHFSKTGELDKIDELNKILFNALHVYIRDQIYASFGLIKETEWSPPKDPKNPNEGVNILINTIKKHGALLISGTLGKAYYQDSENLNQPIKLTLTEQNHPYKNSSKNLQFLGFNKDWHNEADEAHVVIIDAIKKNSEMSKDQYMVFFRDPNDSSGGKQPENVYVMPYEIFCKHVIPWVKNTRAKEEENFYIFHRK